MAEIVVTPKNYDKYGHAGELIDILGKFDPNALVRAEADGSFSIVDETIPILPASSNETELQPHASNYYMSNEEDGSLMVESEEDFEAKLTPNVCATLTDMRRNNKDVARVAAGIICDSIYDGLVNALDYIMEYNVHAHAHMVNAQHYDMCHIIDNKIAKDGKKRR